MKGPYASYKGYAFVEGELGGHCCPDHCASLHKKQKNCESVVVIMGDSADCLLILNG